MRRVLLLLAMVACLGMTGCAYHGPLAPLPDVNDPEAAEVIVIREWGFKGGGVPIYITLDGVDVYALENNAYAILRVSTGDHSFITWMLEEEKDRVSNKSNFIDLTLVVGDKRYLVVRTNHNPWTVWTIVKEVTQQEGEELLKKSKPARADAGSPQIPSWVRR